MYKIIIFGTGTSSKLVLGTLNEQCEVICYIDNNASAWGINNGFEVIPPQKINELDYDYVIIASQYNDEIYNQLIELGVSENKILQFYKIVDDQYNYVEEALRQFSESEESYTAIATGISYCKLGLNSKIFKEKCLKLAFGSQDLYYDYHLVKYLLENFKDKCSRMKYCIIGLCYYSFQYDMSLSAMKDKVQLYYEAIHDCHHNNTVKYISNDYVLSKCIAEKILKKDGNGNYVYRLSKYIPFIDIKNKCELGMIQAKRDCNKNYPLTVKENKETFKDYLELLNRNNIKPIVVVFPTTKYYSDNFSNRIENEFKNIVYDFMDKYDFQYIDYFRSDLFEDSDFFDVSHLYANGADKFTKILNDVIRL